MHFRLSPFLKWQMAETPVEYPKGKKRGQRSSPVDLLIHPVVPTTKPVLTTLSTDLK